MLITSRRPQRLRIRRWMAAASIAACTCGAGCQVEVGGQTLPSGHYLADDVQYYAPGPEFKLAREAAALKAAQADDISQAAP